MEPSVRTATDADLETLVGLATRARSVVVEERGGRAVLDDLGLTDDPSRDLRRSLADPDTIIWCASIDSVDLGYLVATLPSGTPRVAFVRELWVDTEAREVGVGEALVTAAIAWAIAEEAEAIDAWALPGARATKNLFERLGLTARLLTVRRALD